ncbi:hypothetical protein C8Q77DRAFT_783996 [Trametes polyzona]|nr:hypothetical protein C8Q77DRAFT_783996 [Trametes polyzona]
MSQGTKRKRPRKQAKEKAGLSRQTSLWDAFGINSSKKTTPSASAAASENESEGLTDIIDICSSDAEPLLEAPDLAQPVSSQQSTSSQTNGKRQEGGSKDVPIIVVDSSPAHSPAQPRKALPQQPPKPLYSIFAPKKLSRETSLPPQATVRAVSAPDAPFPDASMQHVRGTQTTFHVPSLLRRTLRAPESVLGVSTENSDFSSIRWRASHDVEASTSHPLHSDVPAGNIGVANPMENIPAAHRRYPAVSRLLTHSPADVPDDLRAGSSQLLWTEKWRPRRADEVLGNERSALYLRDWLLALRLHIAGSEPNVGERKAGKTKKKGVKDVKGTKRRRIIREVHRKRARIDSEEPEDFWIAEDFTDEELPLDIVFASEDDMYPAPLSRLKRAETDDDLDSGPPSSPPLPSQTTDEPSSQPYEDTPVFSHKAPKLGDSICNTILLSGPHGCGKTAAVYACAEELGWDVFEVYPGIGERSGSALNKLIGEVGKNHLVKQTQQQPKVAADDGEGKPFRPKANFFAKQRVTSEDEADEVPVQDVTVQPEVLEDAKPEGMSVVNQSIVLVEEVDVLYKGDSGFWPALLKIIKECRRPVVLTCNDTSLVPLQDIPLQTVLEFAPCPTPLAASYLQALCLAEHRTVDRDTVERLYRFPYHPIEECRAENALHPEYIPSLAPDLRKTINQLHLGESSHVPEARVCPPSVQEDQSVNRLIQMARCIELSSCIDSQLRRPGDEVLRDLLSNSVSPSPDAELGYKHLTAEPQDLDSSLPVNFSTYHWDEAIVDELLSSLTDYPAPDDLRDFSPHLHPLHTAHCGTMLPVLDGLHVPRDLLVRDARAVFVDYEPWIRHMSRIDDTRVTENVASGRLEGTRRTRNSLRSQYELARWIQLKDDALEVLRQTGFEKDASGQH